MKEFIYKGHKMKIELDETTSFPIRFVSDYRITLEDQAVVISFCGKQCPIEERLKELLEFYSKKPVIDNPFDKLISLTT